MEKTVISMIIKRVVNQLVDADYVSVYAGDRDKKILPEEIKEAVNNYHGKLTYPSEKAFADFEDYGATGDWENQVEFTLWYDDEPSDLTMSMTTYELDKYSLDDILVM